VRVQPRHAAFLGIGTVSDTPVSMPFCVPDTALTEYQTAATMSYSCAGQTTPTITTDYQHQANSSCENESSISANFGISVPQGCRITGAEPVKGNLTRREIGSTSAAISGQTVVLTGHLDTAKCVMAAFVHHKDSDADWLVLLHKNQRHTIEPSSELCGVAAVLGWFQRRITTPDHRQYGPQPRPNNLNPNTEPVAQPSKGVPGFPSGGR
jgi:hypothetical protein